jgi:hypothetical protein
VQPLRNVPADSDVIAIHSFGVENIQPVIHNMGDLTNERASKPFAACAPRVGLEPTSRSLGITATRSQ